MKRYVSVGVLGIGTREDPRRPDLKGVPVQGYVVLADSGTEMLILAIRDQGPLDTLKGKSGVKHHGDATREVDSLGQTTHRIPANVRAALVAEAARLGAGADFRPEGYDVGG